MTGPWAVSVMATPIAATGSMTSAKRMAPSVSSTSAAPTVTSAQSAGVRAMSMTSYRSRRAR